VRKRGRTTGLTYGIVDAEELSANFDYGHGIGKIQLTNQIGIKPDSTRNAKFGDDGDSGAVVVNDANEAVGLYFAGDPQDPYGLANPIAAVLTALNVTISTQATQTPVQTGGQTPIQTGGQTPVQTGGQTPVQTGGQTPVQTGGQTPVQTGGQTPPQTPNQPPSEPFLIPYPPFPQLPSPPLPQCPAPASPPPSLIPYPPFQETC
jgi:hypothetical protein